jgi:hypothetical protein
VKETLGQHHNEISDEAFKAMLTELGAPEEALDSMVERIDPQDRARFFPHEMTGADEIGNIMTGYDNNII